MDTENTALRVLLIEDNPGDARAIQEMLKDIGGGPPGVTLARTASEGAGLIKAEQFDVILLDLGLPDSQGIDTVRSIAPSKLYAPVIILTGLDDREAAIQALKEGVQDYLLKGQMNGEMLSRAIGYAIERQRTCEILKNLSLTDPLTGLYNRRGFETLAVQQQQLALRLHKNLWVCVVDIDGMKLINDSFGHQQGDAAILDAAAVLRRTFRTSDLVARLGGDEFAVLCIESSPCSADLFKDRLRKNLGKYAAEHHRDFRLSLSMGVTSCDAASGFDLERMLVRADEAMYQIKHIAQPTETAEKVIRVLVVEDNPGDSRLVREALAEARFANYSMIWAQSLAEGKMALASDTIDVVLLDLDLPDSWGSMTIVEMVKCCPTKPVVVLTGSTNEETGLEAIKYGAQDYLVKGSFTPGTLERIISYAIERKNIGEELRRAREREVAISSRIQQTLLLGSPPADLPGIEFAAFTVPSQQVDGDFYDFIRCGDTCVDILLGDVMGKGIPAALLGAAAKSHFLRAHGSLLYERGCDGLPEPEAVIGRVSRYIADDLIKLESFITLCYARLDTTCRTLRFIDCGHTKTVHYRAADGSCALLNGVNMPLGFIRDDAYAAVDVRFNRGDLFFFYSDGLTEARSPDGEFFGEERVMDIIAQNAGLAIDEINRMIFYAVTAFVGSQAFNDDMTCVLVAIRDRGTGRRGETATLQTTSALGELAGIRSFVGEFCSRWASPPLDEGRTEALKLAVSEAATNIMKHAYACRADGRIEIEASDENDHVLLRLRHEGASFRREDVAAPRFDGKAESGFGVYIIEQSVDEVRYCSCGSGGHEIVLRQNKNTTEGEDTWNCTVKL